MTASYHYARLVQDERRAVVWAALWRHHFRRQIAPDACVLDLGAGYGDFINSVVARRRIAVDRWPGMVAHLAPGVEAIIGPVCQMSPIATASVDFALASNLVEHLSRDELLGTLKELRRVLKQNGTLCLLQPNYRYAYREYFDDYTHVAVFSHVSLADLLTAEGWHVTDVRPRFLPLTIKSRLPAWRWLVGAYLRSPIKPLGKQMLVSARPC